MKLIVGLGNPGKDYENTRHNMGFSCLDNYAKKHDIVINKEKFGGLYGTFIQDNEKIMLLKPQKYINLSGDVVRDFMDYYKIEIDNILIISDDMDMPFGKIKLKRSGSCGGHNGLRNIEQNLKSNEYKRLKIGIDKPSVISAVGYVLGTLTTTEQEKMKEVLNITNQLLEDYLLMSFDLLMGKYNSK